MLLCRERRRFRLEPRLRENQLPLLRRGPGLLLLQVFIVLFGFIAVAVGLLVLAFGVLKLGALVASA